MGTNDGTDETTRGQRDSSDDSISDKEQKPIVFDSVKYIAALFAVAAVALAVFVLLLNVVDQDTLGLSAEGIGEAILEGELEGDDLTIGDEFAAEVLAGIGVFGILASTFIGVTFGRLLRDDDQTAMIAAASAFAGVLVLWVLGGFLAGIFTELSEEFGDLLVNGVLAGIGAAIAGAGGVWTTRNFLPATLDPRSRRKEPEAARRERE